MTSSPTYHWAVRSQAEVPPGTDWLAPAERAVFARLRLPKRRADWRVGRWAAKQALAECLRQAGVLPRLADIVVLAAQDGAPEAQIAGTRLKLGVSLSHSGGLGFAVAGTDSVPLGCDIERVEPRSPGFVHDYFTAEEAAFIQRSPPATRPFLATLLWSAKESALKVRRQGLRADTRSVEVHLAGGHGGHFGALSLRCTEPVATLHGCWWVADGFVHTIAGPGELCAPGRWQDEHDEVPFGDGSPWVAGAGRLEALPAFAGHR